MSFHQLTPDLHAHNAFPSTSEERDDEVTIPSIDVAAVVRVRESFGCTRTWGRE